MLKTVSTLLAAAALALLVSTPAQAIVISASSSVGNASSGDGAGLSGSVYKPNTTYLTSLDQGRQLAAAMSGPTSTFSAVGSCFPSCGNSIGDGSGLAAFLGSSGINLSANIADISRTFLRLTGYISISAAGTYTFGVGSDDGSSLSIGGTSIVSADGLYSYQTNSSSVTFTAAGLYPILVEHIENGGSAALTLTQNGVALTGLLSSSFRAPTSQVSNIPEPASLMVLGAALTGLGLFRRRRG